MGRDLKPENVMLVQRGDDPNFVKWPDFGLARDHGDPALATRAGSTFGSALAKRLAGCHPRTRRLAKLVRALASLAVFGALSLPAHARAQDLPAVKKQSDEEYNDPRLARGFQAISRPNGIAEVGVGWLTLPGASVCTERSSGSGCRKGDTSFDLEAWEVYRWNKRFAFGAGLLLGLIPTTDAPRSDPPGIQRNHKRSYLTLEGMIRHYPYVGESLELWWGVSGGLAVVSDRFTVDGQNSDLALVGQGGVTIRTEGETIGLVGGAVFFLAPHWSLGTVLRYGNWFLPKKAAKDPLLDEASLAGRNTMFSLGLSVAYRIPL